MAKTNTPFMSFGSQGTVGQAITSQKRGSSTLLREKPLPAYRYSLPQAYQRWLYEDYAYLWRQQSLATRQTYATAGTRFHLTGFQYWMKYQLTNLPDIMGWWRLDDSGPATTPDSSKQGNTATIIGCTPSFDGIIGRSFHFDGLNDLLNPGQDISMYNPIFSFEIFAHTLDLTANQPLLGSPFNASRPIIFRIQPAGQIRLFYKQSDGVQIGIIFAHPAILIDTWYHIVLTGDGTTLRLYVNGTIATNSLAYDGTIITATREDWQIGRDRTDWFKGYLDNPRFRNRALDQTEITRNSERSYPPQ